MKGYKGFDKDLKCRDLQYEVGKETAVDGDIELCKRGIHFCENPHDIFSYYAPGENNRFAVVEAEDVSDERNNDDSKRVCRRLTVKAEISVFEICKIAVSTFFENFGFKNKVDSTNTNNAGDCGDAKVYGNAEVCGDAKVCGNADYCCFLCFGSACRTTTAFHNEDGGVTVVCGCFTGSLDEFAAKVQETHGDNSYGREYRAIIEVIKLKFGIQ